MAHNEFLPDGFFICDGCDEIHKEHTMTVITLTLNTDAGVLHTGTRELCPTCYDIETTDDGI